MRRLGYLLATVVVATALMGATATAKYGNEWCDEDPVFNIRGTVFRLTASIRANASDVTGVTYDVTLPGDAEGVTTVAYPQGRRLPTTVNVTYSGPSSETSYSVSALVTVSGPAGTAVRLHLSGPSVAAQSWTGSTESAVTATFSAAK